MEQEIVSAGETAAASLTATRFGAWLAFDLGAPHQLLSWAVVGGGVRRGRRIAWLEVRNDELALSIAPQRVVACRIAALPAAQRRAVVGATVLLTSARLDAYVDESRSLESLAARCIATVGLGNAVRVGAPPTAPHVGTINLLCRVSAPLSPGALLEALSIAVEARTAAVLDARVAADGTDAALATGTGTDCVVIAAPLGGSAPLPYAGKHTALGSLLGSAVEAAVRRGVESWRAAQCDAATATGGCRR